MRSQYEYSKTLIQTRAITKIQKLQSSQFSVSINYSDQIRNLEILHDIQLDPSTTLPQAQKFVRESI